MIPPLTNCDPGDETKFVNEYEKNLLKPFTEFDIRKVTQPPVVPLEPKKEHEC